MKKLFALLSTLALAMSIVVVGASGANAVTKIQTGRVAITGNPMVTGTLYAEVAGLKSGTSVRYTWKIDGLTVSNQDYFYLSDEAYSDKTVKLFVSAKKSGYKEWKYTSPAIVEGRVTQLKAGSITGSLKSGSTLQVDCGTYVPALTPAGGNSECAIQWQANGLSLSGANNSTLDLTSDHIGARISASVAVSAPNLQTNDAAISKTGNVIGVMQLQTSPTFSEAGLVGDEISITELPTWNIQPDTIKYQWYRSGKKISGATRSYYTLKSDDWHKYLSVKVIATKTNYETHNVTFRALDYVYKITTKSGATWSGYNAWDSCDYDDYYSYLCWRNSANRNWASAWNDEDYDNDYTMMNLSANAPAFSGQVVGWRAVFTGTLAADVLVLNATDEGMEFVDVDGAIYYSSGSTWRTSWSTLPIYSGSRAYASVYVGEYGGFTVKSMKIEVKYIH